LTLRSLLWALQQAVCTHQRTSLASNRRRARRIHRRRFRTYNRDKGRGSSRAGAGGDGRPTVDGRPTREKNRRKVMEARHLSGSEGIYRSAANPAIARGDPEPRFAWNRIGPPAISNQFHAINAAREANTQRKHPTEVRSRVAHAPRADPGPAACPQDHRARKDAPKCAIRDMDRS
jgi:hypothetical protein